jgi:hypothetical protein
MTGRFAPREVAARSGFSCLRPSGWWTDRDSPGGGMAGFGEQDLEWLEVPALPTGQPKSFPVRRVYIDDNPPLR